MLYSLFRRLFPAVMIAVLVSLCGILVTEADRSNADDRSVIVSTVPTTPAPRTFAPGLQTTGQNASSVSSSQTAEPEVWVYLEGLPLTLDPRPIIIDGRTLIPVRAVAEAMGGTVTWDASESLITVEVHGHTVVLKVEDLRAYLDGELLVLDVAPKIVNDRTMMPIRFVAESVGYTVEWDEEAHTVDIRSKNGSLDPAGPSVPDAASASDGIATPAPTVLYEIAEQGGEQVFRHYLDGYRITLPEGYEPDLSMPKIRTLFSSEDTVLEIYREDTASFLDTQSYLVYNNQSILSDPVNLTVTENRFLSEGEADRSVLAWHRRALSRIPNDKNYYYKADIVKDETVYTLFFKSSDPKVSKTARSVLSSFVPIPSTYRPDTEEAEEKRHGGAHPRSEEAAAYYEKTFGENAERTWGIFEPSHGADPETEDDTTLGEKEAVIGYHFPILLTYTGIRSEYDSASVDGYLKKAWENGSTVELTIQNPQGVGPSMLYDVLDGKYDWFFEEYAAQVADFEHPVLLRLFNEMNGDWCMYSAYRMGMDTDLSRELYRYVAGFFERAGADNVLYIFNPNSVSFPNYKWNHPLLYYPGDEYADIWGLTAYNTGTYYPNEKWQSFQALYRNIYDETRRWTDMPLMITEFACARQGGSKEAWVRNMLRDIGDYPDIKVAVWWDHADYDGDRVSRAYYMLDSDRLETIWWDYFHPEEDGSLAEPTPVPDKKSKKSQKST